MAVDWNDNNWKELMETDKMIGVFTGAEPEVQYWCLDGEGEEAGVCCNPKNENKNLSTLEQKIACANFIEEQKLLKGRYRDATILKREFYPGYHNNLQKLFDAIIVLQQKHGLELNYMNFPLDHPNELLRGRHRIEVTINTGSAIVFKYETNLDLHSAYYYAIAEIIKQLIFLKQKENKSGGSPDEDKQTIIPDER